MGLRMNILVRLVERLRTLAHPDNSTVKGHQGLSVGLHAVISFRAGSHQLRYVSLSPPDR